MSEKIFEARYVCRNCKSHFSYGAIEEEYAREIIENLVKYGYQSRVSFTLLEQHECLEGGIGIGEFCGFNERLKLND